MGRKILGVALPLVVLGLVNCQQEGARTPPPKSGPIAAAPTGDAPITQVPAAREPVTEAAPSAPPPPPRADFQQADIDPENDLLVAPPDGLDECSARLERAGIRFRPAELPLKQKRGQLFTCGAEQVVTYLGGPAGIRYNGAPTLTCRLALALNHFEQMAQEEAQSALGSRIVRVTHIGTYSCRKMARFDWVSEHSYANAIDIQAMTLANGRKLTVEKHFGALGEPPNAPEGRFWQKLANRAYDEEVFSVVLTPYWDKLHKDHLHLDLARYRVDGSRP